MKPFKALFLSTLLLFTTAMLNAEETPSGNADFAIYGSAGGYGYYYAVGGEYLFFNRHVGINVNFSYIPFGSIDVFLVPVFLSFYVGGRNHRAYAETGVLCGFVTDSSDANYYSNGAAGIAGIGYNYSPASGGLYFKIGPQIITDMDDIFFWGGASVGIVF